MKKILALAMAVMSIFGVLTMPAAAATTDLTVRVNGYAVEFPDAQPYIDENSRTLIPVRFVTEAMEADVSWVQATQTAVIERNGIKVEITIGKKDIKVTKNGKTETVTMDTVAVNKESRTYVPIRYVAEALGAYVDYSNTYRTVGIYCDVLSTEEIETLRSYDYSVCATGTSYEYAKKTETAEDLAYYYGVNRDSFAAFENCHEFLYREPRWATSGGNTYKFKHVSNLIGNTYSESEFVDHVIDEVLAEINYSSDTMKVSVKADASCVYHPDVMTGLKVVVRAIVTTTLSELPASGKANFTVEEGLRLSDVNAIELDFGETGYCYVDFVVQTVTSGVSIVEVIPLCDLIKK